MATCTIDTKGPSGPGVGAPPGHDHDGHPGGGGKGRDCGPGSAGGLGAAATVPAHGGGHLCGPTRRRPVSGPPRAPGRHRLQELGRGGSGRQGPWRQHGVQGSPAGDQCTGRGAAEPVARERRRCRARPRPSRARPAGGGQADPEVCVDQVSGGRPRGSVPVLSPWETQTQWGRAGTGRAQGRSGREAGGKVASAEGAGVGAASSPILASNPPA